MADRQSPDAIRTLVQVAEILQAAQDDWWLVGGAAVALQGLAIDIADVDVLLSRRDMRQILGNLDIAPIDGATIDRFRSDLWSRWMAPPLSVDLMTGLQVRTGEHWTRVEPSTREAIAIGIGTVYVPSRSEWIAICELFGRPKDLERAEGLIRLG